MSGKKVLLVEGPDDEHVVKAFLGRRELVWLEEIRAYIGKTSFSKLFQYASSRATLLRWVF